MEKRKKITPDKTEYKLGGVVYTYLMAKWWRPLAAFMRSHGQTSAVDGAFARGWRPSSSGARPDRYATVDGDSDLQCMTAMCKCRRRDCCVEYDVNGDQKHWTSEDSYIIILMLAESPATCGMTTGRKIEWIGGPDNLRDFRPGNPSRPRLLRGRAKKSHPPPPPRNVRIFSVSPAMLCF